MKSCHSHNVTHFIVLRKERRFLTVLGQEKDDIGENDGIHFCKYGKKFTNTNQPFNAFIRGHFYEISVLLQVVSSNSYSSTARKRYINETMIDRNLQTSKAPIESHAQGTSLFTSAVTNQIRFPEGQKRQSSYLW